ncbi:MAG: hypothetical protein J3K34DRAFT_412934 [Monoraphidium minutum]|nr:MAG: hypothetical protein J3K34DRAFT_412934 [Monoraphidium minutum]
MGWWSSPARLLWRHALSTRLQDWSWILLKSACGSTAAWRSHLASCRPDRRCTSSRDGSTCGSSAGAGACCCCCCCACAASAPAAPASCGAASRKLLRFTRPSISSARASSTACISLLSCRDAGDRRRERLSRENGRIAPVLTSAAVLSTRKTTCLVEASLSWTVFTGSTTAGHHGQPDTLAHAMSSGEILVSIAPPAEREHPPRDLHRPPRLAIGPSDLTLHAGRR